MQQILDNTVNHSTTQAVNKQRDKKTIQSILSIYSPSKVRFRRQYNKQKQA